MEITIAIIAMTIAVVSTIAYIRLKTSTSQVESESTYLNEKVENLEKENSELKTSKEQLISENGLLKNFENQAQQLSVKCEALNEQNLKLTSQLSSAQTELEKDKELSEKYDALNEQNLKLTSQLSSAQTALQNEKEATVEKLQQLEASKEKMTASFKVLATEILSKQSQEFTKSSEEKLKNVLNPLSTKIKEFEEKVKANHEKGIEQHENLKGEIKRLQEMNQKISEDAVNLTNALKGESKTQGCWGEMILERILETAGLQKGINYKLEESINTEEGKRFRPDAIIELPENKQIVIDSKVSITAYERYYNSDDQTVKEIALKEHVNSIKTHIKTLSEKSYHQLPGITSVDMVLMFIPIEPALGLALQTAPDLFEEAMNRNIVLVTPSTLLATMRTVAFILRQEKLAKNSQKIADDAGKLYDKLVAFATDLEKVGKQLKTVNKSYDDAMNKFSHGRGNVLKRAEDMRKLGIKTSKNFSNQLLDAVEDSQPLLLEEEN